MGESEMVVPGATGGRRGGRGGREKVGRGKKSGPAGPGFRARYIFGRRADASGRMFQGFLTARAHRGSYGKLRPRPHLSVRLWSEWRHLGQPDAGPFALPLLPMAALLEAALSQAEPEGPTAD